MLGIKCVADDDFTGPISSALLKVIAVGNLTIIMALPTGSFRAVRDLAFKRQWVSVETLKDNFLMGGTLGKD